MGDKPPFVTGSAVHAVSRSTDKLDIYATSATGAIHGAAWEPGVPGDDGMPDGWRGWWPILDGGSVAGAEVTGLSRTTDKLDTFVVAANEVVYTAAWEPGASWKPWREIGDLRVPAGAPVHGVSRSTDKLDIFVTGIDNIVHTTGWEPANGTWIAWRSIGDVEVPAGSPVSCVSRAPDKLDLFVVAADGRVLTCGWEPSFGWEWSAWRQVAGGTATPGSRVAAASRSTDKLDVVVVGTDGRIWTSAWEPKMGDEWSQWRHLAGGVTTPDAIVSAVSRSTDKIDVVTTDVDGRIQTSAWEPKFGWDWAAWRAIGDLRVARGAVLNAVSKHPDQLDVFAIGTDGRVHTAAWQPSFGADWRGWWPIG